MDIFFRVTLYHPSIFYYVNNTLSNLGKENKTKGRDEKKDGKQVIDTDFDQ